MPSHLKRYQHDGSYHYITFSCYRRLPLLETAGAKETFESTLEQVRRMYQPWVFGYVVMPEHVHLLVSEPQRGELKAALQMLKQLVSRRVEDRDELEPLWQPRYYDFNVFTQRKFVEKLRYIHRNPVSRGLVKSPEDWRWSSFRHWMYGEDGTVEIESEWTFRKRERMGMGPRFIKTPETE